MPNTIFIDTLVYGSFEVNLNDASKVPMSIDTSSLATGNALIVKNNNGNNFIVSNDGKISFKNYHFPVLDGASSQILFTDGAGNLYWGDPNDNVSIRSISSNTTLLTSDKTVKIDCSSGMVTITVPVSSPKIFNIKKIDSSSNMVKVIPSSGTIDGQTEIYIQNQYTTLSIHVDGSNGWII